jgi:mRNA interferase MazF
VAKGDIILVKFPFTDFSGNKLRPAVILAETDHDVTHTFITTQLEWQELTDIIIKPTESNGIKKDSLIRVAKIATIDKDLVPGLIGKLTQSEISELNSKLKIVFALD